MEIYVQSRGASEDYDYCWLKITPSAQQPQIPPMLTRSKITELIQSEAPSLVLARDGGELLLLVTGLEASEERTDFRGRKIRNSVAWVGQDEDEPVLRAIAVQVLRGELRTKIDDAVTFGGDNGFLVSWEAITQLALGTGDGFPDATKKIARNSSERVRELALEIQQYRLPRRNGPLVVVTGIKTEAALKQAGVWRGLSSRVNTEDWKQIDDVVPITSRQTYTEDGLDELSSLVAKIPYELRTFVKSNKLPLSALIFVLIALLTILF